MIIKNLIKSYRVFGWQGLFLGDWTKFAAKLRKEILERKDKSQESENIKLPGHIEYEG